MWPQQDDEKQTNWIETRPQTIIYNHVILHYRHCRCEIKRKLINRYLLLLISDELREKEKLRKEKQIFPFSLSTHLIE
jgi:hypothetical protein